jgi:hypothetical protein
VPRDFGNCSRCGRTESETRFGPDKYRCRECLAALSREYHHAHKAERNARTRQYKDRPEVRAKMASPEFKAHRRAQHALHYTQHHRAAMRMRKYGVTQEAYDALFAKQGGLCAICQGELLRGRSKTNIDHCHTTGIVRGLLCHRCNLALGHFDDSVERLEIAIAYLRAHMRVEDMLPRLAA